MEPVAVRRLFLLTIALCGLSAGLASTSTYGAGESPVPAWCFDSDRWQWLYYYEGIPGSSSQEDFTDCLSAAADRGEVIRVQGQVLRDAILFDVGDNTLLWATDWGFEPSLTLTAYDDRIEFYNLCDQRFELRHGSQLITQTMDDCFRDEASRTVAQPVERVDFSMFVIGRQFIFDAVHGWYQVHLDETGWNADHTPRSGIELQIRHGGAWLTTKEVSSDGRGWITYVYEPLAGTIEDPQRYRLSDWLEQVRIESFPREFEDSSRYSLPSWEAYLADVGDWLSTIVEGVYDSHEPGVEERFQATGSSSGEDGDETPNGESRMEAAGAGFWPPRTRQELTDKFPCHANAAHVLRYITGYVRSAESSVRPGLVASLVRLWQRHVPDFDSSRALDLAQLYSIDIDDSDAAHPILGLPEAVFEAVYNNCS